MTPNRNESLSSTVVWKKQCVKEGGGHWPSCLKLQCKRCLEAWLDADSAGLGWAPRLCISDKLSGASDAFTHWQGSGIHLIQPSICFLGIYYVVDPGNRKIKMPLPSRSYRWRREGEILSRLKTRSWNATLQGRGQGGARKGDFLVRLPHCWPWPLVFFNWKALWLGRN